MTIQVGTLDVRDAFRHLGVTAGDIVLFHGSLSSMGYVLGGVTSVFDGILEATSPGGTVAMPSLWYNGSEERRDPAKFDVNSSPSYIGALSEGMRLDPRRCRSNHFSHAVSAIGSRAAELCAVHASGASRPSPWSDQAFGHGSPWQKLYDWDSWYCFIGVTMRVCTMKHFIEGELVARTLARSQNPTEARNLLNQNCTKAPYGWPYFNSERLQKILQESGHFVTTTLGSATLGGIRTRTLVNQAIRIIEENPLDWLGTKFIEWQNNVTAQNA